MRDRKVFIPKSRSHEVMHLDECKRWRSRTTKEEVDEGLGRENAKFFHTKHISWRERTDLSGKLFFYFRNNTSNLAVSERIKGSLNKRSLKKKGKKGKAT